MAWDFSRPIESLDLAEDLASMVSALDLDEWRTILRNNRSDLPQSVDAWRTRDRTADAPRVVMIEDNAGQVILIQGVKREDTALRLMQEYGERVDLTQPGGLNSQVRRAALELDQHFFSVSGTLRHSVLLAGHSYGGATAQAWGAYMKEVYPTKDIRVITFGAPRTGIRSWSDAAGSLQHVRYWIDDDPVPLIPPHTSEARAAHTVLRGQTSGRWNAYNHHGRGVVLGVTGGAVAQSGNTHPPALTEINIIGWATGILQRPVQSHSIHEYYLRLSRAKALGNSWHVGPQAGVIRQRRPAVEPPPEAPQEVPVVAAQIEVVEAAVVAERELPLPTDYVYRNVSGKFAVLRGEEFITFAATRARAIRIARTGNTLLRQARARGVDNGADIARVLAGML